MRNKRAVAEAGRDSIANDQICEHRFEAVVVDCSIGYVVERCAGCEEDRIIEF